MRVIDAVKETIADVLSVSPSTVFSIRQISPVNLVLLELTFTPFGSRLRSPPWVGRRTWSSSLPSLGLSSYAGKRRTHYQHLFPLEASTLFRFNVPRCIMPSRFAQSRLWIYIVHCVNWSNSPAPSSPCACAWHVGGLATPSAISFRVVQPGGLRILTYTNATTNAMTTSNASPTTTATAYCVRLLARGAVSGTVASGLGFSPCRGQRASGHAVNTTEWDSGESDRTAVPLGTLER